MGKGLAVDSTGNIYVCGQTIDGAISALILKFSSAGALSWVRTWNPGSEAQCTSLVLDGNGGLYLAGYIRQASDDALLLKFDEAGGFHWARSWSGPSNDRGLAIVLDDQNNPIVAGITESGAGGSDSLFLKYDGTGNLLVQRTWGSAGNDHSAGITGIAGGAEHRTYLVGESTTFGITLLEFDRDGFLLGGFGSNGNQFGTAITKSARNSVYLVGGSPNSGAFLRAITGVFGTPSGAASVLSGVGGSPQGVVGCLSRSKRRFPAYWIRAAEPTMYSWRRRVI